MRLQPFQSALDCCVVNKCTQLVGPQLGQGSSQLCSDAVLGVAVSVENRHWGR